MAQGEIGIGKRFDLGKRLFRCRASGMAVRKYLPLALLLVFAWTSWGVDFRQSTGDKQYEDGDGNSLPYRLFKPQDYCGDTAPLFRPRDCDPDRPFPLVVYFHGAGERGLDNKLQASGGGHMENLYRATNGETFEGQYQAFLLAPQCPSGAQWVDRNWTAGAFTQDEEPPISQPMQLALALLDEILETYPIDKSQVYVTGLSMGGYGTWDALRRRPELFAAAMPLSGGGNKGQGELLAGKPVWMFHGSTDSVVPVSGADDMRDAIEAAGGSVEYTRINAGHSGWSTFYNGRTYMNSADQTIYEWLFAQSLTSSDYTTWLSAYPALANESEEGGLRWRWPN